MVENDEKNLEQKVHEINPHKLDHQLVNTIVYANSIIGGGLMGLFFTGNGTGAVLGSLCGAAVSYGYHIAKKRKYEP